MVASSNMVGLLATLSSVFVTVNGHMIMKSPVPYSTDSLNNSPLVADGSDFPCKLRDNAFKVVTENKMAIGEQQTLSFTGSAVHGGGSCQLSITTDRQPSKDSKFQVIHSIEGGCPANVDGNLPADPNGGGASTFDFSIPEGVAAGQYTLAWTWFNKIGNREMYMNCAPITVTSGSNKRDEVAAPETSIAKRADFPSMFVANIAGVSDGCATSEGVDVLFPNPGNSVQKVAGSTFGPPVGCSGSSGGASSPASGATASSEPASSAAANTVAPGVFASGAASASSVATTLATSTAAASPAATVTAAASGVSPVSNTSSASGSASTSTSSTSTGTQSGTCTDEGAYACSADGSSFQRCASGQWSVAMSMSTGTKCTPGVSDNLNMTVGKRDVRFSAGHAAHIKRNHHAWKL